jgi:hypothetical protein
MARMVKNNYFLSLRWNSANPSFSSYKKKVLKMKKIKFDPKIEFGTIKGTNHLITKKDGRLK